MRPVSEKNIQKMDPRAEKFGKEADRLAAQKNYRGIVDA
jgi:hypothetical protein